MFENLPPIPFETFNLTRVLDQVYHTSKVDPVGTTKNVEDFIRERSYKKNSNNPETTQTQPMNQNEVALGCDYEKFLLAILQNPTCNVYSVRENIELAKTYARIMEFPN